MGLRHVILAAPGRRALAGRNARGHGHRAVQPAQCFRRARSLGIPARQAGNLHTLRLVANGEGTEVVFLLFRQPGMSDEDFFADAATVTKDLKALKRLLEGKAPNDEIDRNGDKVTHPARQGTTG